MAWRDRGTVVQHQPGGYGQVQVRLWQCDACGKVNKRAIGTGPPMVHNCGGVYGVSFTPPTYAAQAQSPQDAEEASGLATPGCKCSGCKLKGWR